MLSNSIAFQEVVRYPQEFWFTALGDLPDLLKVILYLVVFVELYSGFAVYGLVVKWTSSLGAGISTFLIPVLLVEVTLPTLGIPLFCYIEEGYERSDSTFT